MFLCVFGPLKKSDMFIVANYNDSEHRAFYVHCSKFVTYVNSFNAYKPFVALVKLSTFYSRGN